ncbi:hypothetical protein WJX84_007722 [Apatococcus fuscideae]|uniref:Uncharacterized protein n=1 Tax=Apatococcus fuscideae TaxID=2026836 RepID=A0AAW1T4Z8_9CHLO
MRGGSRVAGYPFAVKHQVTHVLTRPEQSLVKHDPRKVCCFRHRRSAALTLAAVGSSSRHPRPADTHSHRWKWPSLFERHASESPEHSWLFARA